MINIFKTRRLVALPDQLAVAKFNATAHRANAYATIIARDPLLFLGRLPQVPGAFGAERVVTNIGGPGKQVTDQLVEFMRISPSLVHIVKGWSPSNSLKSMFALLDLEQTLSQNFLKEKLTGTSAAGLTSMGAHFNSFLNMEAGSTIPMPLSRTLSDPQSPASLFLPYLSKMVQTGNIKVGLSSDDESTTAVAAILDREKLLDIDKVVELIGHMNAIPDKSAKDLVPQFSTTNEGIVLTSVPTDVPSEYFIEGLLNFFLSLNDIDKLKKSFDSLKAYAPISHVEPYLTSQQMEMHKTNFASSAIILYYNIAPLIRDFKYFLTVFDHPVAQKLMGQVYVDVTKNEKLQALFTFVRGFELPGAMAAEMSQSYVSKVSSGENTFNAMSVEETYYDIYFKKRDSFRSLFEPNGLLTKMVELQVILENSFIKPEVITNISKVLGTSESKEGGDLKLTPATEDDIIIGDTFRATKGVSSIIEWTRSHFMHIFEVNKPSIHLKRRLYKAADQELMETRRDVKVPVKMSLHKVDFFKTLSKKGFIEDGFPVVWIEKDFLDAAVKIALTSSKAAQMVPFPFTATIGANDEIIPFGDLSDLTNYLGYFGEDPSILETVPFARRVMSLSKDGTTKEVSGYVIVGPTGLKLVTHAALNLIPVWSHWSFDLISESFGTIDNLSLVPTFAWVSLPADQKATFTLSKSFEVELTSDVTKLTGLKSIKI